MKIILSTHLEIELVDPAVEIISTLDDPINQTFTPTILFVCGENKIGHTIPASAYIKGTWTDEDVENAIQEYIKSISVK